MSAKFQSAMRENAKMPRTRSRAPMIVAFTLTLIVSPVLYEWGLICYGNWQSMVGSHYEPHTPVLNYLVDSYQTTKLASQRRLQPMLHLGRWNPAMAVPLAVGFAAFGALMLRKGH